MGPATDIIATLSTIYRRQLPLLGFQPSHLVVFHVEKYDHRFRWHHPDSVIEIWVPVTK